MSTKASKKNSPASANKTDKSEKKDTPKNVDVAVEEEHHEDPDVAEVDPDAEIEVVDDTEEPTEETEEPAEDADADAEEPTEETEEPAEEDAPAKKGKRAAAKPTKKGAKTTAKAPAKPAAKKPATKKEPSEEQKRYDAAFVAAVDASYVTDFEALKPRSVHDKCGNLLSMYILEAINQLQQDEVVDEKSYNPYPSSKYILLEDKLSGATASKGKTVKKTGDAVGKPSKKRLPPKRGQKKQDEPEPEVTAEADEEPNADAEGDQPEAEADAEGDQPEAEATESKAPAARGNIVTINRNGKTYLGFLMMRFVDELYSTDGGKNIRSNEEFTKFVMEKITKDIQSHLARVIVCTVNRNERRVAGVSDHTFQKDIGSRFDEFFDDRSCVAKYLSDYLMKYFKLLAQSIAADLWVAHKGVNGQTIEKAMRQLNMGNYEYMVDAKYVVDGESDYGLTRGILNEARGFDLLLNPPPTEAQKKERADKRKKAAEDKAAGIVPATKPKGKAKAAAKPKAKAAAKPKGRGKKPVEEPEPEQEAEQEAEAEAEPEEEEQPAEEEEPAEEEPAPEPEPVKKGGKKILKKL